MKKSGNRSNGAGRVLLVEDDASVRTCTTMVLENEGYDVECAENGKTGVKKALSKKYDLVLMDYLMPDINGYQALTLIREKKQDVKVALHSSYYDLIENGDQGKKFEKLGLSGYMPKPYDVTAFIAAVKQYMEG